MPPHSFARRVTRRSCATGIPPDRNVRETQGRIAQIDDHWQEHGFGDWAVVSKYDGHVIGFAGLHHIADMAEVNVGYALERAQWHRGLGQETCRLVLAHGFDRLRLPEIVAVIDPRNTASIALVEKCGFALRKQIRWSGHDRIVYRIAATCGVLTARGTAATGNAMDIGNAVDTADSVTST